MSVVALDDVKKHLRVIHTADDDLLKLLIAGAEDDEAVPRPRRTAAQGRPVRLRVRVRQQPDPASGFRRPAPTVRIAIFFRSKRPTKAASTRFRSCARPRSPWRAPYRCRMGA